MYGIHYVVHGNFLQFRKCRDAEEMATYFLADHTGIP